MNMSEAQRETENPYELLNLPDSALLHLKQQALQFLLEKVNETELTDRQLSGMSGVAEDKISRLLSADLTGIGIEDLSLLVALFGGRILGGYSLIRSSTNDIKAEATVSQ
jgi:hypothetical protein